jgi:hypothetical protein
LANITRQAKGCGLAQVGAKAAGGLPEELRSVLR